jgi:putative spermidine/putrescine transport system permease protein
MLLPAFVEAFSVFPCHPAGLRRPTRVISIAAYEAAFEHTLCAGVHDRDDRGACALVIVAAVLALRNVFYRGPVTGGKG